LVWWGVEYYLVSCQLGRLRQCNAHSLQQASPRRSRGARALPQAGRAAEQKPARKKTAAAGTRLLAAMPSGGCGPAVGCRQGRPCPRLRNPRRLGLVSRSTQQPAAGARCSSSAESFLQQTSKALLQCSAPQGHRAESITRFLPWHHRRDTHVVGPVPEVDVMAKRPQGLLNVGTLSARMAVLRSCALDI
jgi:hypothetical protein